jgi:methylmalonyl-CoA mutase N-terminal domain/subunit
LDEAIALPTDFSARIARNTQIYIQEETEICKEVDPWAGSYYVENLTNELAEKAWALIEEVEKLGGMAAAIETGFQKCVSKKLLPVHKRVSTQEIKLLWVLINTVWKKKIQLIFWKWTTQLFVNNKLNVCNS